MAAAPIPGPGQPGGDDWDADADLARFLDEVNAGRIPVPDEDPAAPAVMVTLGEAADVDPAALAAMAGPDGLGGEGFAQDKTADALRPGPLLAALTENAAASVPALSDNELLGLVSAARRLQNRAEYLELAGIAEFTARRAAQFEASKARGDPRGCRAGEFADAELASELLTTAHEASGRMDLAVCLATRLPARSPGWRPG
ncbi:hypothetical protein [Trebonia sp.]|uniref:hypothetical protein n=1 Tax=Trebonia sp. TaxID=2767075 RepID=UPI00262DD471|nr:hypothetical protein [Trebonia sp.]